MAQTVIALNAAVFFISLEGEMNPVSICSTNNNRDMDFFIQCVKIFPPDGRLFSGGFCCLPGASL
jgi:hypothetical protein